MPNERQIRAAAGCSSMQQSLRAALGGAKVMADDEDLPTQSRPRLREAVVAVEHAIRKVSEISGDIAAIRGAAGAKRAY